MEILDLYDIDRLKTSLSFERGSSQPEKLYRLVVHVCIFNNNGEMLIQQRQSSKRQYPGLWDVSVGGCAISGETSREAIERELFEELGLCISFSERRCAFTINFDLGFDDFYIIEAEPVLSSLRLQADEVQAVCWADRNKILQMKAAGEFIPYNESLIDMLFYFSRHSDIIESKN